MTVTRLATVTRLGAVTRLATVTRLGAVSLPLTARTTLAAPLLLGGALAAVVAGLDRCRLVGGGPSGRQQLLLAGDRGSSDVSRGGRVTGRFRDRSGRLLDGGCHRLDLGGHALGRDGLAWLGRSGGGRSPAWSTGGGGLGVRRGRTVLPGQNRLQQVGLAHSRRAADPELGGDGLQLGQP